MSSNLVVKGLSIKNSPMFNMKFDGCEGVLIDELSISSPKLSPNTDGIHIENTKAVGIYNSKIANGSTKLETFVFYLLYIYIYIIWFIKLITNIVHFK